MDAQIPGRFRNLVSLFRNQFNDPFLEFAYAFSAYFFHVNTTSAED